MTSRTRKNWLNRRIMGVLIVGVAIISCLGTSGCQVSVGGQLLPSAYYQKDDLQYFPKGPEFPLTEEALRLREASADAMIN